jgi:hypothetical protein
MKRGMASSSSGEGPVAAVLRHALDICNASERGGRYAVHPGGMSGCIYDCACWPDEYSEAVLAAYPSCRIRIVSAHDRSATGFAVRFDLTPLGRGEGWWNEMWAYMGVRASDVVLMSASIAFALHTMRVLRGD